MVAPVDEEVLVDLEVLVGPRHERRRVAHGAEQTRRRYLGVPDVAGVPAHPEQADPFCEVDPGVAAALPAVHRQITEPELVQHVPADGLGIAHPDVAGRGVQGAAEPRHQGLLLDSGAERLNLVGVEAAEPQEEMVGLGQPVVEPQAELVRVLVLRFHRGQVLDPIPGRGERYAGQERAGDGVDPVGRDPVAGERPAPAGRGIDGERIADRAPPGEVAGPDRRVRHREGPGDRPPRVLPLVAREEEGAVADDGAAESGAELVLIERGHRPAPVVEVVVRVEPLVAHELEQAPVERVCAGPGRHVDQGRRLPAELGRVHRLLDLELLNGVDRRVDDEVVEELVGDLEPVQHVDVVPGALSPDVGQRTGLLEGAAPGAAGGNHHRVAQLGELQELPSVQGDLLDLPGLDDVADLGRGGLEQRGRDLDRHLFGDGPEGQRELELEGAADLQPDAALRRPLKAGQLRGDGPLAGGEAGEKETPFAVGNPLDDGAAVRMGGHDAGAGQDGAALVDHDAQDLRGVRLGGGGSCRQQRQQGHRPRPRTNPVDLPVSPSSACTAGGAAPAARRT